MGDTIHVTDQELCMYNMWVSNLFERVPFSGLFNFKAKGNNAFMQTLYMLDRTQSMFEYDGLPDTIPQRIVELYLQVNGHLCFAEVDDNLYVFTGGLGGVPDVYYMPTVYTVANPALNYSRNLKIGEECAVVSNDSMYLGLMPLYNRYASAIAENELSLRTAVINSRIVDLIAAQDDATKASAELFLKQIEQGELGVIMTNMLFDEGIKTAPYGTGNYGNMITSLIEHEQYLKAAWYNDLGLNANYNMKREALSTAESQLNDDALLPLVDDLLRCRQEGLERVNAMFGTNITVRLASSWEDNQIEVDAEQSNLMDNEPEQPEEPEKGEPENEDRGIA